MEDNNDNTTDDRFLFDINIKKVSESTNLDILINEWIKYEPMFDTEQEIKGQCICNRYIKYINYFYNKINGNIIMVGDTCKSKLKFKDTADEDDKYVKMIISKGKGIYKNINDIINYNIDVVQQVMALITYDVELTNGIKNINKLLDTLNKLISIQQILVKNKDFYDFIKCKIIILEERKQIIEEELKLDEKIARELKENEILKQNVKLQFEEGYYKNITKNDKDKEIILLDYLKQQNNKYIQSFIDKYKDNIYLYDKIKKILDNKLYFYNLKKKEAEEKNKQKLQKELEEELEKEKKYINLKKEEADVIEKEYQQKIKVINELLYKKQKLVEEINIIDTNINKLNEYTNSKKIMLDKIITETNKICKERNAKNEIPIINKNIILYNNNIEKWKLMTDKKETNENNDDYKKRIIYTKNGPLKIKDIILLSEIKIDKDIEDKIRHIGYREDTNEEYIEIGKSWLVNYIDYKEFINFDINTICNLTLKFYSLNTKTLQYLRRNYNNNNKTELEFYIRYKLGQRIFLDNDYHHQKHLKFDFDEDIEFDRQDNEYNKKSANKYIIELFNNFYNDKTVLIHTCKGLCYIKFININTSRSRKSTKIIDTIEYTGKGTVDILMAILNY